MRQICNKRKATWQSEEYVKNRRGSIQFRLVAVFLLTSVVLLAVNLVLHQSMNRIVYRLDSIYATNVSLNELQDILDATQDSLTKYMNTKSSDAMQDYFMYEDDYMDMVSKLNHKTVNQDLLMMEKNIRGLSMEYLQITNKVIDAKRGRNIDKYKVYYEEATMLYDTISTYINSLNSQRFAANSKNYKILQSAVRYSQTANTIILILVAIANTILVVILTREITQPLKKLSHAANHIAGGDFEVEQLPVETNDEIGVVTYAFNEMVRNIKIYIEQIRKSMEQESAMKEHELMMENHLKDAQLKYLQAQINPHFLFNTLNAGAQLAMLEGADRTYTYIQNVADFFRYCIKTKEETTLEDELIQVEHYIYILNVRFSGDIHFKMDIDNSCRNITMPGMILQPIVENSVNYGIRDIDWQGKIELSAIKEDDYVCISIRDNGVGMSQEKINKIMSGHLEKDDISKISNGVGLDNVIQRLRMFYNKEDVMEITSVGENLGTEVAVKLYWRNDSECTEFC